MDCRQRAVAPQPGGSHYSHRSCFQISLWPGAIAVAQCDYPAMKCLFVQEFRSSKVSLTPDTVMLMHETSVQAVEDMSVLSDLHEAAILYNIFQRYQQNRIYVSPLSIYIYICCGRVCHPLHHTSRPHTDIYRFHSVISQSLQVHRWCLWG